MSNAAFSTKFSEFQTTATNFLSKNGETIAKAQKAAPAVTMLIASLFLLKYYTVPFIAGGVYAGAKQYFGEDKLNATANDLTAKLEKRFSMNIVGPTVDAVKKISAAWLVVSTAVLSPWLFSQAAAFWLTNMMVTEATAASKEKETPTTPHNTEMGGISTDMHITTSMHHLEGADQ